MSFVLFFLIGMGFESPPSALAAVPRSTVEVSTGRGYIAPVREVFRGGSGTRVRDTYWIDFKIRPLAEIPRYEALGFQLGAHQSSDFTKTFLCGRIPSIAGRIYCSTAEEDSRKGSHLSAVYAGAHLELVEFIAKDPRDTLLFFGLGETMIRTATQNRMVVPFASIEFSYRFTPQFEAKASAIFSLAEVDSGYGMSAPNVSMEYRF